MGKKRRVSIVFSGIFVYYHNYNMLHDQKTHNI